MCSFEDSSYICLAIIASYGIALDTVCQRIIKESDFSLPLFEMIKQCIGTKKRVLIN